MKMKRSYYERIKLAIRVMLDHVDPTEVAAYKGRVSSECFRWGLLWRAYPGGLPSEFYRDGINDSHIDTVLRNVVAELEV